MESLESDFRPLDITRDFFKSTPNLNNKEIPHGKRNADGSPINVVTTPLSDYTSTGHARSTSYTVSYGLRKNTQPATDVKERNRHITETDHRSALNKYSVNLARSRSAQSLKLLGEI